MDWPLEKRAEQLIWTARLCAISMSEPITEKHSILAAVSTDVWDSVLTTAAASAGILALAREPLGEARYAALCALVEHSVTEWHPQGMERLADCQAFVAKSAEHMNQGRTLAERQFAFGDTLAIWALWNIYDKPPASWSVAESAPTRALGLMITQPFATYWRAE